MSNKWDVIIIGGGAIGAATAYFLHLKRPTLRTLLLEAKKEFGHGTTGTWGSLIRVFSITNGVSERALTTVPYFLNFEERVGKSCGFLETGSLYFFKEQSRNIILSDFDKLQAGSKTPLLLLDSNQGRGIFPQFQWLDGDYAVYEPRAGYACPFTTTRAWIDKASERGLTAKSQIQVTRIHKDPSRLAIHSVETQTGEIYRASQFLVCAGPWSSSLLQDFEIPIAATPSAIQINRFQMRNSVENLPFFLDYEARAFAKPSQNGIISGGVVLKQEASTSNFRQPLSLKEANEAKKRLSSRLKLLRTSQLAGGLRALEMYSTTANPAAGFDSNYSNLYIATGWSCSGFVLSPFYGEKIAKELIEGLG